MARPPVLASIPPGGSLGVLAYGYRGVVAWRAVRGTGWLDEERERYEAAREAAAARRRDREGAAPDLTGVRLAVVSGLPRAGTSMLMQMLAAGGLPPFADGARAADASNPRGYYEHDRIRSLARDASWLPEADGRVAKVVAPLLPHLPPGPTYRVLYLHRDLDEVLRSQRRMLGRLGRPAAPDDALRPAYRRHEAAARAWITATDGADALNLDYAAVVADPGGAARRIEAFLGLGLDVAAMAAAVDPALHRERG